jgi:glyoxylase-like metal-dependent hydrolase (beta-lactamase superfamily II)
MTLEAKWINEDLPEEVHLIDLPQKYEGFRYFINSWFFIDSIGRKILVDPGPASTIPILLKKLETLTDSIDIVLLTHIHLDHSGGIGHFSEFFPNVSIVVHRKARKHLMDPTKLWNSSLNVLGDVAKLYGVPKPLEGALLVGYDELPNLMIIETPGHSPHHLAFIIQTKLQRRLFFVGESMGLRIPLLSTEIPYLRPATPPKFDAISAKQSLEKIRELIIDDDIVCFSHWGVSLNSAQLVSMAQDQLNYWISTISDMRECSSQSIIEYLLDKDLYLSEFKNLPDDIKARELLFIENSILGMIGYITQTW